MVKDAALLMARYCDGEISALGELYAMTAPKLLSYLRMLLRNRTLAEDVLQDTYLKIHVARDTYMRGADPVPWLYTIARRTALDELRRVRRRGQGPSNVDDLVQAGLLSTCEGQDADTDRHDRYLDAVLAGLDTLPEGQRTAIELTRLKGKSMAEVALLFGTKHRGDAGACASWVPSASKAPARSPAPCRSGMHLVGLEVGPATVGYPLEHERGTARSSGADNLLYAEGA